MKIIKQVLSVILVLLVVVIAFGFFLPTEYEVSRSIVINAPNQEIHSYLNNLKKWGKWSPWVEKDPSLKVTLGEITSGVGATQSWIGDSGEGSLIFTYSDPDSGIDYDLDFNKGKYKSTSSFQYEPLGDSTKVVWSMSGDTNTPIIGGFFAYKMDSWVGSDFEKGLKNLKKVVEKGS